MTGLYDEDRVQFNTAVQCTDQSNYDSLYAGHIGKGTSGYGTAIQSHIQADLARTRVDIEEGYSSGGEQDEESSESECPPGPPPTLVSSPAFSDSESDEDLHPGPTYVIEWSESYKTKLLRFLLHHDFGKRTIIQLVGQTGAGAKSFVSSINCVVKNKLVLEKLNIGTPTTQLMRYTLLLPKGQHSRFQLRVMPSVDNIHLDDIQAALDDRIMNHYQFSKENPIGQGVLGYKEPEEKAQCVGYILDYPRLDHHLEGLTSQLLHKLRQKAGDRPLAFILTWIDHAKDDSAINTAIEKISRRLRVPRNTIFPVRNYTYTTDTLDTLTDIRILHALRRLLEFCEDYYEWH